MYQPNWIVDKHNVQKWESWKLAHPQWEARAAEIGVDEAALRAWVIGATSFVPGSGVYQDWDTGPLAREIYAFHRSEHEAMQFGVGTLRISGMERMQIDLYGADGVCAWSMPMTFINASLSSYQTAELLKEAWYMKASDVLDSCSKANIPLDVLYAPSITALQQKISAAVTAEMNECGLLPLSVAITPNYVDVGGMKAYVNCAVEVGVDDKQTPVAWSSGKGAMVQLKTWGARR
jgi:hypothetical protein